MYLNAHESFCLIAVGVQGAGKSHTIATVLENCLFSDAQTSSARVIRLQRPTAALVLHYDQNMSSICESTALVSPAPWLEALCRDARVTPPVLPRERLVVLVSPSYFFQRKAFYAGYCEVRPLLFQWRS